MKVISFCIYGSKDKYCKGLDENLKLIQNNLPDYNVFIYVGQRCKESSEGTISLNLFDSNNVPDHWISTYKSYQFVKIIYTEIDGMYNRCQRFLPIDDPNVEIMIVRDTDSRLHKRDIWCIRNFESSNYLFHAIRDHPEHGAYILAGLWGIKKQQGLIMNQLLKKYLQINSNINYVQYDQYFLRDIVYPLVNKNMIVYAFNQRMQMVQNENIIKIPLEVINDNFCGLAIDYDESGNEIKEYKWNYGYECIVCRKPCGPSKCGKCGKVIYCSRDCQVGDWKKHKLVCNKI
jgi:hypothetical protein